MQSILNTITGISLRKTAELQPALEPNKPVFKVVPDKELRRLQAEAFKKERIKIEQRPPFMNPRKEIDIELARNPEIAPVMTHNLLFIDTSAYTRSEKSNKDKLIVVRDTEGTLREARHGERERAIQIAFPAEGRTMFPSNFFKQESIENALKNCRYSYILDRLCLQYEPDDPEFIRMTRQIYNHILVNEEFDTLRGTRHFGSLAFYLALCRREELLMLDMLQRYLVLDACDYLSLLDKLHMPKQYKRPNYKQDNVKKMLEKYVKKKSTKKTGVTKLKEALNQITKRGLANVIEENQSERAILENYLKE